MLWKKGEKGVLLKKGEGITSVGGGGWAFPKVSTGGRGGE